MIFCVFKMFKLFKNIDRNINHLKKYKLTVYKLSESKPYLEICMMLSCFLIKFLKKKKNDFINIKN